MKIKYSGLFLVLILFVLTIFTGCPSALLNIGAEDDAAGQESITDSGIESGFTLIIPGYAPWILETASGFASRGSRAFAFNDSVDVIVRNSSGSIVLEESFAPEPTGSGFSCEVSLIPDTGYTAEVRIFNHVVSTTEPMVQGLSSSFDIDAGLVTQVPITCFPLNPVILELDTEYNSTVTVMPVDSSWMPQDTGSELWFQGTIPPSGYVQLFIDAPENIYTYFGTFYEDGTVSIGFSPIFTPGSASTLLTGDPGQIFYIAFVFADTAAGDASVSLTWTEVNPVLLSDTDIPDPQLRALMEDYTGKEFSTSENPSPDNPVMDIDLEAISIFKTDGGDGYNVYTGITDLTGIGYLKNVSFLLLNDNDLSAEGIHLEELAQLTELTALDVWGCNLRNLDFLEHLINPNFSHLKFGGNPELTLSHILSVTSGVFPEMQKLGFCGYDTTGDGVADPVSSEDWSQIVDMLATHSNLENMDLNEFGMDDAMFTELLTEVISPRASVWRRLAFYVNDISSITGLAGLTNLEALGIEDNDMELWPGTDNRTLVDYYIGVGVDVDYESGNQLIEPVLLSDADVPDPWLRTIMEYGAGNGLEFATETNPTPDNQISLADLGALQTIDVYMEGNTEQVVISDLTGLDYCDNVNFINFSTADLSVCDQTGSGTSYSQLAGMDSLEWINISFCQLSDLDFISGIANSAGIYIHDNPDLDSSDIQVLSPSNFPNLVHILMSGWDLDSDGDLDQDDIFSGDDWAAVQSVLRQFNNLTTLQLSRFYEGDTNLALLFDTGEVLDVNYGTVTQLMLDSNSLTNASLPSIAGMSQLDFLILAGNPEITDISGLTALNQLEYLDLDGCQLTGIEALETLFNAGAFQNHQPDLSYDIRLNNCQLELWEGSPDRVILDNLIANGVRVSYDEGNQFINVSYDPLVYSGLAGQPLNITPDVTGNVSGYSINPGLPDGLALDPFSGIVSGISANPVPPILYTVSAWDDHCTRTAEILLSIEPFPGATVTGTITLPEPVENKLFLVCLSLDGDIGSISPLQKSTAGFIDGTTASYTIANALPAPVDYYVYAIVYDEKGSLFEISGPGTAVPVAGDYYGELSQPTITITGTETITLDGNLELVE